MPQNPHQKIQEKKLNFNSEKSQEGIKTKNLEICLKNVSKFSNSFTKVSEVTHKNLMKFKVRLSMSQKCLSNTKSFFENLRRLNPSSIEDFFLLG